MDGINAGAHVRGVVGIGHVQIKVGDYETVKCWLELFIGMGLT